MVCAAAAPAANAEGNGPPSCPYGFPLVMTLDRALVHYGGAFTEEEIRVAFAAHDTNGNGFWCYKLTPALFNTDSYPQVFLRDDIDGGKGHPA